MEPLPLPEGVTSRMIEGVNGLDMHVLEAGDPSRPAVLLLHGFPEIAFSWRKLMLPIADLGFHVIAPDQRGYGRTTGWANAYDTDLFQSRMPHLVRDMLGLLRRLGHDHAAHVLGHDFGASVAGWAGQLRPDVFRTITVMSAPFNVSGLPPLGEAEATPADIDDELGKLERPRKHYQLYYSTPPANADMMSAPMGLKRFLHAYFHMKGGGWHENTPVELDGWTGAALAAMPTYYIMDKAQTMPEAVAEAEPAAYADWLPEPDLDVYTGEYARTGFQGGLNWYRCRFVPEYLRELALYGGKPMTAPLAFIGGANDWGVRQTPGALEAMEAGASEDYRGTVLVPGAGHWVQQENPTAVFDAWKALMLR